MFDEHSSSPAESGREPEAVMIRRIEAPTAEGLQRISNLSEAEKQLLDALVIHGHHEWHASLLLVLPCVLLWFAMSSDSTTRLLALLCVAGQSIAYVYLQRQYASMEKVLSRYMHYCSRVAFHLMNSRP
jgi:hypothetical protein